MNETLSEHDDDPTPSTGHRSLVKPIVIIVVIAVFVVLHITGVLGPSGH